MRTLAMAASTDSSSFSRLSDRGTSSRPRRRGADSASGSGGLGLGKALQCTLHPGGCWHWRAQGLAPRPRLLPDPCFSVPARDVPQPIHLLPFLRLGQALGHERDHACRSEWARSRLAHPRECDPLSMVWGGDHGLSSPAGGDWPHERRRRWTVPPSHVPEPLGHAKSLWPRAAVMSCLRLLTTWIRTV